MVHWLNNQYWFTAGANWWQWITSLVALVGWVMLVRSHNCGHPRCFRIGQVPVRGTHHKLCKRHARQKDVTH